MQEFGAASQRDRKRPRTARGSLQAARKPGPTPSLVVAKKDCVAIVKLLQANAAEGSMQHFAGEFAFAAPPVSPTTPGPMKVDTRATFGVAPTVDVDARAIDSLQPCDAHSASALMQHATTTSCVVLR